MMFNCDNCTRLEYRKILDGQNPDEYTLPFCKKYDKQLFTDITHFFIDGNRLVPCEECKKDEYEYFMEKSKDKIDMSYEEAVKIIDVAIAEVEWYYPMDYIIAFNKAKKAIEKQISKKPSHLETNDDYICPLCHQSVVGSGNYCGNCGQALDWEG